MKKNHNRFLIMICLCVCLCLTSTISAMQMGGFDIDIGNGENNNWQWQEEQQWNQSGWENTWENNRQTGDNIAETPVQNDQTQDNGYQYNSDIGNKIQDNMQQWDDIQQNNTDWDNGDQWDNNFTWNNQFQVDKNMQTTSGTDNESTVKMPEEALLTSTPIPRSEENPKPTKTPKSTQTPTPEPIKKKNKKKRKKADKSDQVSSAGYAYAKDEPIEFQYIQNPDNPSILQIQIISRGSVQILSFRLGGTECPWHWEGDCLVSDMEAADVSEIELLVISQGGKLTKYDKEKSS